MGEEVAAMEEEGSGDEEEGSEDEGSDEEEGSEEEEGEKLSTHERRQQRLATQIAALEEAAVAEQPWKMQGEVPLHTHPHTHHIHTYTHTHAHAHTYGGRLCPHRGWSGGLHTVSSLAVIRRVMRRWHALISALMTVRFARNVQRELCPSHLGVAFGLRLGSIMQGMGWTVMWGAYTRHVAPLTLTLP